MEGINKQAPSVNFAPSPTKRLFSVVIPSYRPLGEWLFDNLAVMDAQVNFDFRKVEVVVVDDCSSGPGHENPQWDIPPAFFSPFRNLPIRLIHRNQNGGPGLARQTGIEAARGEYVTFIDADDMFYGLNVFAAFAQGIEKANADQDAAGQPHIDVFNSSWAEEVKTTESLVPSADGKAFYLRPDRFYYARHDNDQTWMHGKIFRRDFLSDNGIAFDDLRVHEDRRFNLLAFGLARNMRSLQITGDFSYLWRYRANSITRAGGAAYSYNSIAESVEAADRGYNELLEKHPDRIDLATFDPVALAAEGKTNPSRGIVQTIQYTYFVAMSWMCEIRIDKAKPATPDLDKKIAQEESALADIEKRLGAFCAKYRKIYEAYPYEMACVDYQAERTATCRQMPRFIEPESLQDFICRITEEDPK